MSIRQPASSLPLVLLGPNDGEHLLIVGDRCRILVDGAATGGQTTFLEAITAPGAGPPLHSHANEDEYFYVQEGAYKFSVNGRVVVGGPGTFAFAPRGSVHAFINVGKTPAKMLVAVSPSGIEKPFRENAAIFRANPNAPMDQIVSIFERHGITFVGPPLSADA